MSDVHPPEGAPEVSQLSATALSRVWRAFTAPGEVFREIAARPTWLWPLVVMVVLSVVGQLIVAPRVDLDATIRQSMEQSGRQLTDEQMDQAIAISKKVAKVTMYVSPLFVPVLYLLIAGIYFLLLKLVGSETEFGRIFSGTMHATIPADIVKSVLLTVVAWQKESFAATELETMLKSNVAAWLPEGAPQATIALGGVLDVFNVWKWILLVLALEIIGRVERKKAIGLVAAVWGVWALALMALRALR